MVHPKTPMVLTRIVFKEGITVLPDDVLEVIHTEEGDIKAVNILTKKKNKASKVSRIPVQLDLDLK